MRINQALIKCCLLSNKTIECALLLWCDDDDDDVYTLSVQVVTSSRYKSHSANLVVENPSEDWWATSRFTPMLFFEMANQSFRDCPKCHVNHRHNSCFDLLQFPQFSCQVLIFFNFLFLLQFYPSIPWYSYINNLASCLSFVCRNKVSSIAFKLLLLSLLLLLLLLF